MVRSTLADLINNLEGQNSEKNIDRALRKAESTIKRSYYGSSPKKATPQKDKAIHVNDTLDVLKTDISDIHEVYDYLSEYVHPNQGSNRLVSSGELGVGELEPDAAQLGETLDRIATYAWIALGCFVDGIPQWSRLCLSVQDLGHRTLKPGITISTWLSKREARPKGDGKTKETAYLFPNARTPVEAKK